MTDCKIIFSGSSEAENATAITMVSDVKPIKTDRWASVKSEESDYNLTYGTIQLSSDEYVELYGTAGQEKFDFMREILSQNSIGLILLIDNTRPDPFHEMHCYLDAFKAFIEPSRMVIGVTNKSTGTPTINDYHLQLEESQIKIPIFEVDVRSKKDVTLMIETLLYLMDPGL